MSFLHDELVDVKFKKDWEALTINSYYQAIYMPIDKESKAFADDDEVIHKYNTIFNQLKRYEDTGLGPDDIKNVEKAFYILKERGEALERLSLYLKACIGMAKPKIILRRI